MDLAFIGHLFLHVLIPVAVAWLLFRPQFTKASLLMLAGMLIDLDHLLATPILDPTRCSVGFHLLHSYWMIPLYLLLAFIPNTRLLGIGLVIHIALDWGACIL